MFVSLHAKTMTVAMLHSEPDRPEDLAPARLVQTSRFLAGTDAWSDEAKWSDVAKHGKT